MREYDWLGGSVEISKGKGTVIFNKSRFSRKGGRMNKLEKTPTVELIENLDKLELQIRTAIFLYEENRKELLKRFPELEKYDSFKEKFKIEGDEDVKIYHL